MFKITRSLCLSLMMLPALINAKPPKHQTKDGFVIVEAEEFHAQSANNIRKWYRLPEENDLVNENSSNDVFIKNASNGSFIGIFPDTRKDHNDPLIKGENFSNEPGKMALVTYKVHIDEPGRYYVWARVFSTGSEDNGVHVGIDGTWPESGQRMQWCMGKNDWRWESSQRTADVHCGVPGSIYLDIDKAGDHEIQFSMREDGFKMDQFILTNDKTFNPRAQKNTGKLKIASINEVIKQLDPTAEVIPASQFDKGDFYIDQGKWLAIQPEERKSAKADYKVNDKSGNYDVIFFAIGENDGQSTYQLQVNGASKGNYKVPLSKKTFEEGLAFAHPFRNVSLKKGDVLSVEAKTGSKDGSEYSRGRWSQIILVKQWSAHDLLDKVLKEVGPQTTIDMSGELKKWHKLTLTFDGPFTSEKAAYNPFMNYRLNVTFSHKASGKSYMVPGYFAADGVAGNSSSDEGNKWKVHFSPDEIGEWEYNVDFRKGAWSAVSDKKETGKSGGYMDGASGSFTIAPTDKSGNDFRSKGRLQYVGERYLKFAETGEYFLKQGPDAPENLLAFIDFDGDFAKDGHKDDLVKDWSAHLQDWNNGDVTWKGGKGKALIGALNYLASKGLNSVSFLTNNIAGDDQNVFPYIDYDTYDRIDISKMDQWEMVFQHAQKLGLFLHFKTLEAENQGLLDNGGVGANSKLYYRELMARFGHHLALNWNLCEENGEWMKNHETPPQDTPERLAMAHYFKTHDPYHHHLVIHNGKPYDDLLGPESGITGPSIQTHKPDFSIIHKEVLHWLEASKKAGFQWAAAVDEPGDAQHSLLPDAENPDHDNARRNALWGTLMAGGWGNEWYFGYAHAHSDLTCQDFRSRDLFWDQAVNALRFFKEQKIPFWEMENKNDLVGNSDNKNTIYCFAKENEIYVVYLNSVVSGQLDLTNADGDYEIWWFNPKKGEKLRKSKVKTAKGGTMVDLGKSPDKKQLDWVVMVKKK